MISKKEYNNFKQSNFTILPVSRKISAPNETPLSLYSKISDQKNNFLFESVEGGDRWAQYSIIGFGCLDTIKVSGNKVETSIQGVENSLISTNPLQAIEAIIAEHSSPNLENLPRFHGGYIGFFAYESAQYAEAKIAMLRGKGSKFAEHMPDIMLVKAEKLIVFDNLNNSMLLHFQQYDYHLVFELLFVQLNLIILMKKLLCWKILDFILRKREMIDNSQNILQA